MLHFYERYQLGDYQNVYDELLSMKDAIYTPALFEDVSAVMRAMMQRVRTNIEFLFRQLPNMGYIFHKGLAGGAMPSKEYEREMPIFQPPAQAAQEQIQTLEQLSGTWPLSLKYFYEEVGCVNLVGAFSSMKPTDGYKLDPLFIFSQDIMMQQVTMFGEDGWQKDPRLLLTGDCHFKYGYGGGGTYDIELPCKAIDTLFVGEPHNLTFVNYLRLCFRWGGLPGLEDHPFLSQEELLSLTHDLLPF